jgi:hypothetical protein
VAAREIPASLSSAIVVALAIASCTKERITAVDISAVTVAPPGATLLVGDSLTLSASVEDGEGRTHQNAGILWASEDSSIARVGPGGRVEGRAAGTVEVVATFRGVSGRSVVRVYPGPSLAVSRATVRMSAAESGAPPETEQVSVFNAGAGPIDGLTASVEYPSASAADWLRATVAAPSAPTVLTLEAESTTMPTGIHEATVVLTAEGVAGSPLAITVTLTVAGYGLTQTGGSTTVSEAGTTDAVGVVLTSQPFSNVVLAVLGSDAGEAVVSPSSLTFTPENWSTPQSLTVTGVDDPVVDGDQVSNVRVAVEDASSDDAFDALPDRTILVTTSDNDQSGFIVSETGGTTLVSEAGTTDEFTVVLAMQPASSVVLTISGSDDTEATLAPASLTFTPASWSTPQTITVTGVDDALSDGDQVSVARISVSDAGSDDAFDQLPDRLVSVTTDDNDQAAYAIAESGGFTSVSEVGTTDSFTVVLTTRPSSNVVFRLTSSDVGEATAAPAALTFTPANWSTAQAVTVTGVDDALVDGEQISTIRVSVDDAASDNAFDPLADGTVSAATADNDQAGFSVAESGGSTGVSESGTTDQVAVVLNLQPGSNVVFSVTTSDPGEATIAPASLTFTSTNWSTPQTITITGVDDPVVDGSQVSTVRLAVNDGASDNAFDPLADRTVSVTTADDDQASFSVTESSGSTIVGESGTLDAFTVVLGTQPASNVVLSVAGSDAGEATIAPGSLTFTSANWSTPQTVTVTGIDDPVADGNQISTARVSVNDAMSDDAFDSVADRIVSVTTSDDDPAGITVTESGGSTRVSEAGATDGFTVMLTAQPISNVMMNVVGSDPTEATATPSSLTFTPANWSAPQTVTVSGIDDGLIDGDQVSTVRLAVDDAASDDAFDPLADRTVPVTTTDDDQASFTVTESGGSTTVSESGTSDAFVVSLGSQPASNVVFDVVASDATEATVSPSSLTFTPANWSTPQIVGVTGVEDPLVDGSQTSTVMVSVNDAASDNAFDPLASRSVTVTTADNDAYGFVVTESGGSTIVSESGTRDTVTVVLTAQPASNVSFTITASDTGEATVAPSALTFTPVSWATPQTVIVSGVYDLLPDGNQVSSVRISVNDGASDNAFDPLPDRVISVTTTDSILGG